MQLRILVTWLTLMTIAPSSYATLSMQEPPSPLRQYIAEFEAAFSYTPPLHTQGEGATILSSTIDALSWRSPAEVSAPLWRHKLTIVIPEKRTSNHAVMIVEGGSTPHLLFSAYERASTEGLLQELAKKLQAVVVLINTIPNQPLEFFGDGIARKEDDLIAYSWAKFLATADPSWLAQFPMTKSVVTALNVSEEILSRDHHLRIGGWMLTGASKRGWISWLTAAVDPRIIGIAPIVIDALNLIPSMRHHFTSYGFWGDALKDYVHHGIMAKIDTPQMQQLEQLIDPFAFNAYYTMPKMILNAANDEFFLPDSSLFYFDSLPGKKFLRYVPNSGHRLNNPDALFNLLQFFRSLEADANAQLPQLSWHFKNGRLSFAVDRQPLAITLWEAVNPHNRDFRFREDGNFPHYVATELSLGRNQQLAIRPAKQGTKAFFVELLFAGNPGTESEEYRLTTSVFMQAASATPAPAVSPPQ